MKPEPVNIAALERADRSRIDWNSVHIAADQRKPFARQHPLTKRDIMENKDER